MSRDKSLECGCGTSYTLLLLVETDGKNAADTGTLLQTRATSRKEGDPVLERQSDSDDYQDNDRRPMVPRKHACPAQ